MRVSKDAGAPEPSDKAFCRRGSEARTSLAGSRLDHSCPAPGLQAGMNQQPGLHELTSLQEPAAWVPGADFPFKGKSASPRLGVSELR